MVQVDCSAALPLDDVEENLPFFSSSINVRSSRRVVLNVGKVERGEEKNNKILNRNFLLRFDLL